MSTAPSTATGPGRTCRSCGCSRGPKFSLQPREPSNESAHLYCTANTRLAHGHGDGNGDGDGDDDETSSRFLDPLRSVARVVTWRAGGTLAVIILVASILRRLSQWA